MSDVARGRFVPGLVAFLLAHVCYIVAYAAGSSGKARAMTFVVVAAVLFMVSDTQLVWDRFGGGVPARALLVLSSYWLAQWCIARSVQRG